MLDKLWSATFKSEREIYSTILQQDHVTTAQFDISTMQWSRRSLQPIGIHQSTYRSL